MVIELGLLAVEDDEQEGEEEYMATLEHDNLAGNIYTALKNFLKDKNMGRVFSSSAEYRFLQTEGAQGRRGSKQPDVSFISKEKLPERLRSYPDIVPDLAVEVSSPNDKEYLIEAKVALYQKYGVKLVWLVHPYSRLVNVYRLTTKLKPQPFTEGDLLDGEIVISGFQLAVSDIFDYPPDPDPIPDPKPVQKSKVISDESN